MPNKYGSFIEDQLLYYVMNGANELGQVVITRKEEDETYQLEVRR
jgi:hypothetical protein